MKALVLAGGTGTRLRPFSYSMPKQLIPVAGKPVLLWCLENIKAAGVTDVGVIVGSGAAEIEAAVGSGAELGLNITYIPQDAPRGLAHCVRIAAGFLGDDDFVMYLGDNVVADGIAGFAEEFRASRPAAQLVVAKVADPSSYGIAELDPDGQVVRLVEKPREPRSDLAVIGVYFFTAAVHEAVRSIGPSGRGEYEITDAIQWLVDAGHDVRVRELSGYWKDTGQIEEVLDCNRVLLDSARGRLDGDVDDASTIVGEVVVEAGARVIASTVIGPAIVGAGTVLAASQVGPHVAVGRHCLLAGTSVEDSIVLDDVCVRQVRGIRGSLIGRSAQVHTTPPGDGHRLLIGDHATVRVAS
jgi:glucose-1-phosphate thymidylyltransferase